ncbi:tyrosine phosphatase family-domain-containing protein [Lipomyces kononenkoae]
MPVTSQSSNRPVAEVETVDNARPVSATEKDDKTDDNGDILDRICEKNVATLDFNTDHPVITADCAVDDIGSRNAVTTKVFPGYVVPENFAVVAPGIYRSSFPHAESFDYLKTKNLKSILVLVPEPYPEENMKFMKENNIQFFQVGMSGNKEPFVNVSDDTISTALKIAINPANHPLLIHCNRGKHRTGCLVGCLRKLQDWSLTMIFDEYRRFAHPKVRPLDQQFIELYDEREVLILGRVFRWLPLRWDRTVHQYHSNGSSSSSEVSVNGYGHQVLAPPVAVAVLPPPAPPPLLAGHHSPVSVASGGVTNVRLVKQSVQN